MLSALGLDSTGSVGVDGINVTEDVPLCFIKYLLRERYVRMRAIGLLLKQLQT